MRHFRLLFLITGLLLTASLLPAQSFRARVQGTVADSSGAVVATATVTLTNVNTGVSTETQTNELGIYRFDYVNAGSYRLTIELEGFNKYVQENIAVQSQGDVTVDAILQLGNVAETITVSESPVAVQFNSTNLTLTIDTKLANELPRFDRNPFKLSLLNPAAVNTRGEMNPYHSWAANSVELGGGTNLANDLQVDGSPIGVGHKAGYTPSPEAIQEVNIQQNNVDAESGHSAGGYISMTMKSGTNDWHGNAYYLHRNPSFNAVTDRTTGSKSASRNNIWGGTLGNPIVRNKLFNFFSYEAWQPRDPLNYIRTMPTSLERQGDFSQTKNAQGNMRQIFDPYTTVFDPANNKATRTPFPNNRIPASQFDGVASKLINEFWDPNNPGENIQGANNFKTTILRTTDYWNFSDRVDWNVSEKLRIYGRVSYLHTMVDADDPTPNQSMLYVTQGASARHAFSTAGDAVWTINPTTIVNVNGSYHYIVDDYNSPRDKLGEEHWGVIWPHSNWYQPYRESLPPYVPRFQTIGQYGQQGTHWEQNPKGNSLSAKLSQQRGSHYLKMGVDTRRSGGSTLVTQTTLFRFDADVTAETFIAPKTNLYGYQYATFLLGALKNNSQAVVKPIKTPRSSFYGLFFQDDWKLNRRISLNLGMRWEYESPWRDPEYRMSRGLDLTNPHPEMSANPPDMPARALEIMGRPYSYNGAWIFTDKNSPGMWNAPWTNFMPRAGIAVRMDDKTSLRVGYARYSVPTEFNFTTAPMTGFVAVNFLEPPYFGYDAIQNPLGLLQGVPRAQLYDPFPASSNPLIPPVGKDRGRYLGTGGDDLMWYYQDMKRGTNDRLTISFQRQLPNQMVFDFTYFTNFGNNLQHSQDMNQMDPRLSFEYQAELSKSVPNPFYNYLTSDVFPGPLRNQKNVTLGSLLKPNPQYGNLFEIMTPHRRLRYNSFQFKLQRAFSNGYNFLFGYVYHRQEDEQYYDDVDEFIRNLTWQESDMPRHRFSVASIYEFPFGKGRKHMNGAHPVLDGILGGWQVSGVWYYNSGDFLRFGPMLVSGDPVVSDPTPDRWFDTSVFEQQPAFTRRTNPLQFDGLTGPNYWVIDATISKNFQITERVKTELKMGAYNATNRLNRANPDVGVLSATFGQTLRQRTSTGRQLELGLKIIF